MHGSAERGSDPVGKELARQVFKLGMKVALAVPGARRAVRLAAQVAPEPVEWLALRYRVYTGRALAITVTENIAPGPPEADVVLPLAVPELVSELALPSAPAAADMSAEEARIHRQVALAASSPSTTA
jgi:hypothetical protein